MGQCPHIVCRKEDRAPLQYDLPDQYVSWQLIAALGIWTDQGEERLWEVVRDGSLGRGNAKLLSLARKCNSLILGPGHILGSSQPKLTLLRMLIGEECVIFFGSNSTPRQGPMILRSGFGSKSSRKPYAGLYCSYFASHPCFFVSGLLSVQVWLSSCTNWQTSPNHWNFWAIHEIISRQSLSPILISHNLMGTFMEHFSFQFNLLGYSYTVNSLTGFPD